MTGEVAHYSCNNTLSGMLVAFVVTLLNYANIMVYDALFIYTVC